MSKYCQKLQYKHASRRPIQQAHVTFFVGTGTSIYQILQKDCHCINGFVLVNLYLHHKLYNDSIPSNDRKRRKKITRKKYMENLIDALIETDWSKTARDYEQRKEDIFSGRKRSFAYDLDDNIHDNCEKNHYFNEVNLIWYLNCGLFQKNIGVKQSLLTPRHLRLKGKWEIKTNIIFL